MRTLQRLTVVCALRCCTTCWLPRAHIMLRAAPELEAAHRELGLHLCATAAGCTQMQRDERPWLALMATVLSGSRLAGEASWITRAERLLEIAAQQHALTHARPLAMCMQQLFVEAVLCSYVASSFVVSALARDALERHF